MFKLDVGFGKFFEVDTVEGVFEDFKNSVGLIPCEATRDKTGQYKLKGVVADLNMLEHSGPRTREQVPDK